ncbi:MAG: cytochrome ubiquinol oxidase subunit I [Pseudomonadota bacterium]
MDVVILSRLQFAAATLFHFLFVPLTLGLSILIAIMETKYVRTGDELYKRMAKFWGKLFLINFTVGVVTGITLEFQFGTNWSRYSMYVGDVFGSLLAIEATVAFFMESSFIGIWMFGWNKLSPKIHALTIWLVAFASSLSAVWILIANTWMQYPVGYAIDPASGRAVLTDFWAVVTQDFAVIQVLHTLCAAYVLAGFFVMGISAYHILRKHEVGFFIKSFRIALPFALIFSIGSVVMGDFSGQQVAHKQPTKLAAMESHWETRTHAPFVMFSVPDEKNERNRFELFSIPSGLSLLLARSPGAEVKGLKDFPKNERPPVLITFLAFRIMVGLGFLFVVLMIWGWVKRNKLEQSRRYLKIMLLAIPFPYIASEAGWIVTEVGRQPWIVYRLMRTSEAVSPISQSQVLSSLVAFILVYSLLGAVAFYLIFKFARKGLETEGTSK